MHKDYYEAILQVRPPKKGVERFVDEMFEKTDKAELSKKKWLKEGVDYYVTSYRFAIAIGNALVRKFGGRVEVTKKLFGKRQGKTIFRRSVAYRAPEFELGEVIFSESGLYLITSMGKVIIGKNLETGKKEKVVASRGFERLEKYRAVVSKSEPVQVINNEDYQSVPVENLEKTKAGKLTVVNCRGRIYLAE